MEEIIFIGIIFIIILKFYKYINNVKNVKNAEINEIKNPTLEYYEWKRIYFKMIVLHEFKKLYKKQIHHPYKNKWRNSIINRSAYF